jgi:ribosome-associated protein
MRIDDSLEIPEAALAERFVQSGGPGGQNVNKVASSVQLRCTVAAAGLPDAVRERLCRLAGRRLNNDGEIVILAQRFRTQERNRADARARLADLVRAALVAPKPRRPTRPSRAAKAARTDAKTRRGDVKRLRVRVDRDH